MRAACSKRADCFLRVLLLFERGLPWVLNWRAWVLHWEWCGEERV